MERGMLINIKAGARNHVDGFDRWRPGIGMR